MSFGIKIVIAGLVKFPALELTIKFRFYAKEKPRS